MIVLRPEKNDRDLILIEGILKGSRVDLETLIDRYQGWIYNIALKMTMSVEDAEDITQEILIKFITKLSTFDSHKAAFSTWLYRIVANHVINMKKGKYENRFESFDACALVIENLPDESNSGSPEELILVEELKIKCLTALLVCLDRKQRFIFIMSEIFDVSNGEGARIMELSNSNYRQIRSRTRRKVYNFINRNCGLVHPDNPCHCHKKLKCLIRYGFVDPDNLLFYKEKVKSVEEALNQNRSDLDQSRFLENSRKLFKAHPFYDPPEFQRKLKKYLDADMGRVLNNSGVEDLFKKIPDSSGKKESKGVSIN